MWGVLCLSHFPDGKETIAEQIWRDKEIEDARIICDKEVSEIGDRSIRYRTAVRKLSASCM
jgi:hypothetical protein